VITADRADSSLLNKLIYLHNLAICDMYVCDICLMFLQCLSYFCQQCAMSEVTEVEMHEVDLLSVYLSEMVRQHCPVGFLGH